MLPNDPRAVSLLDVLAGAIGSERRNEIASKLLVDPSGAVAAFVVRFMNCLDAELRRWAQVSE